MRPICGIPVVIATVLISSIFFHPGFFGRDAYASNNMAEIGQPFSLRLNQTGHVEDLDLRFTDVIDSRCPSDVVCIWEGQVSILVHLQDSAGSLKQFELTLGPTDAASARSFGNYSIGLVDVQPYPVSTEQTPHSDYVATMVINSSKNQVSSHGAIVKARSDSDPFSVIVAGWNVEKAKGAMVVSMPDAPKRGLIEFTPSYSSSCTHQDAVECIDGKIMQTSDASLAEMGGNIHLEIERPGSQMYLTFGLGVDAGEHTLNITKYKVWDKLVPGNNNLVYLKAGQRDGPLLVQKIYADRIEALNFREYPISMDQGSPITMRIGEIATNGCTVMLTLVKIEDGSAVFEKTVDENRPCPICWLQTSLLSGGK